MVERQESDALLHGLGHGQRRRGTKMIIAHAPAGYIISKAYNKKETIHWVAWSVVFALWPDLDLFYYYFFDKNSAFHHTYFTHLPVVLAICFFLTFPFVSLIGWLNKRKAYYFLFFINWTVHLLLDTFTGGILWFYPFRKDLVLLIPIPPVYKNWMVSFVFHWSFLLELAIAAWCVILLSIQKRKKQRKGVTFQ